MTITTKRDSMINNIIDYLKENEETFNELIEELDNYNGYLGDDRYYTMDTLYDFYSDMNRDTLENLLQRVYFGEDYDSCHTDSNGKKIYDSFNPNRDYFTYNGYGNLCSTDYPDYSEHLDSYFIDEVIDNYDNLYINDDELKELIEKVIEYDEETDEETEE